MAQEWIHLRSQVLASFTGDPDWPSTQAAPPTGAKFVAINRRDLASNMLDVDGYVTNAAGVVVSRGTLTATIALVRRTVTRRPGAIADDTTYHQLQEVASWYPGQALVETDLGGSDFVGVRLSVVANPVSGGTLHIFGRRRAK